MGLLAMKGLTLRFPMEQIPAKRFGRRGLRCAGAILSFLWLAAGCGKAPEPDHFTGYLEADYVYVAPERSGRLTTLSVARGDTVSVGQALFELDPEPEQSALTEAQRREQSAQSRLADLRKGMRPSEIAALEAKLNQARVGLQLAELDLKRVSELRKTEVSSVDELEHAQANRDLYAAQVKQFEAELVTARLGGREDAIKAAGAEVEAATETVKQAEWNAERKRLASPVSAHVEDTCFRPGEWVAAGRPVVSLLPPGAVKARFFVPQHRISELAPGREIVVSWDGGGSAKATVSFVSRDAEFTPPVIYSRESRAKLVFLVEAVFSEPDRQDLRVGQPIEARLTGAGQPSDKP